MRVVWSPLARDQVVEAFASLAADRPAAALAWFEEVLRTADALRSFPDMGRRVPELRRAYVREVLVHPYRLIYRREQDRVVILVLHHCRRDLLQHDAPG